MTDAPFRIGLLLFPDLTQLDFAGPYEVFARMPGAEVHLVARGLEPVRSEFGLTLLPTASYESCPRLDLVCVPGGFGVNALLSDAPTLEFLRRAAGSARYITSVCTGALLLGAAGLLKGRRATTHWMSHELLREFGAEPVPERVVVDGNLITGGGVTAGIDFALRVVAEILGREAAEAIQLGIEYAPHPPFDSGNPDSAPAAVLDAVRRRTAARQRRREEQVRDAASALRQGM